MANAKGTSEKSYWDAIEPIWEVVSIYDGPKVFLKAFKKLPAPVGHLFAAHWCQSEVRNGGLSQFFGNSTGVLAPEAVDGFKAIGMVDTAALVEKAMAFFGSGYLRDREARLAAMDDDEDDSCDDDSDPFDELDDRFFELIDEENSGFEQAADRYAQEFA